MGRPPIGKKTMTAKLEIRLAAETKKDLEFLADKYGQSVGDYVRGLLEEHIPQGYRILAADKLMKRGR